MTSRTAQTLTATASNGATVTYRGHAEYAFAALQVNGDKAELVARGFVKEHVRSRARTKLGHYGFEVVPFERMVKGVAVTEIPEDVQKHFERKREMAGTSRRQTPMIVQTYQAGQPFVDVEPVPATYAILRSLRAAGVHTVGVVAYGSPVADFPIEPMLRKADLPLLGGSLVGSRR